MESILKTFLQKKLVNSGFLYGPFCPIYVCGAMSMFLILDNFKNNPILLFFISFIILSTWEYIVGIILEKIFHTKYWDYSQNKFNIQGRVCLLNSIYWGILGVIFTLWVHPIVTYGLNAIPKELLFFSTMLITIYLITDTIVSTIKVKNINVKFTRLSEMNQMLKEKLTELKEIEVKGISTETIQIKIEEIKYKQTKLKRKLIRQTNRLRKAFPTMKSESIEKVTEFFNQKIDVIRKERKK